MIESYVNLFESLRRINHRKVRRKTFMDVSGYPHYENVVSNILAFLFDDAEEHRMKNLWLNALLSVAVDAETRRETQNISVEREVYTEKGNRIDLLINSDDYVVCIENKLFSGVGNDLLDYKKTAEKLHGAEGKKVVCVLLSLTPADYTEKELFKNILYNDLFDAVRADLCNFWDDCNNTWLVYVKDFISTIESLNGGNMVNKDFEKLYQTYHSDISNLESAKDCYLAAIKEEAQRVAQILRETWTQFEQTLDYPCTIELWDTVYSTKTELRASVVIDFNLDCTGKNCVSVETSRDSWGWHIALHKRRGKNGAAFNRLLSANEIPHPAQKMMTNGVGSQNDRFYVGQHIVKSLEAELPKETVAKEIYDTIERLIPAFKTCMD